MPYQSILDGLLHAVPGSHAALLLDVEGEVAVEAGVRDYRHRLIGAYQGIALATVQKMHRKSATGRVDHILCRYAHGTIIIRPLQDGYYLLLSLSSEANIARALHQCAAASQRLTEAL